MGLLLSAIITWIITARMYSSGSIGGGDAKGLMALALLFPTYPVGEVAGMAFPLLGPSPWHIFTLTVLINTIFVSIIAPLGLFIYNLTHFETEMWIHPKYMCTGYMTTKERLDTKKHTEMMAWRTDAEGNIKGKIWVTPLLPYMIFITIGYLTALIFGDFLFGSIMLLM
jgi:preflagellin peptidase FlaK